MRALRTLILLTFWIASPVLAQEDDEDGGFIVNFLEENLSGENRAIKVTGLEGALSSSATIEQITVSDDEGVWLTVNKAVLDWNRLALIQGRFSVNALTADEIIVTRRPNPTPPDTSLPTPEAQPFQLPELPVSVEIGKLSVGSLDLAEPVAGQEAQLSVAGALKLADGALESRLTIARRDRPSDSLNLVAGFANETSWISLDMLLTETRDGVFTTLLGIPDSPDIRFAAKGEGPVGDFTADIRLAVEGRENLTGQVSLREEPAPAEKVPEGASPVTIVFAANLDGDLTPLLEPQYRAFFGPQSKLDLTGKSHPDGSLSIGRFAILSQALNMTGGLVMAKGHELEKISLKGEIAPTEDAPVVLPLTGEVTSVQSVRLSAEFDASEGGKWDLRMNVGGLSRGDFAAAQSKFKANGTFAQEPVLKLNGTLSAGLDGLAIGDAGLREAVGDNLDLNGRFELEGGDVLTLSNFRAAGPNFTAALDGQIDGLDSGFELTGSARVQAADLSQFSTLAGRPLGGAISASIHGEGSPLGGRFDVDMQARALNLVSGIEKLDPLISGQTSLVINVSRDQTGVDLRTFTLRGTALNAEAKGRLNSTDTTMSFNARLDDMARVLPEFPGPLDLTGDLAQDGKKWSGEIRLDGPHSSFADLSGTATTKGDADVTFEAAFDKLERFLPDFPGTVKANGTARRKDAKWTLDVEAEGPAEIKANVTGDYDETGGTADLNAKGQVALGAANRFITPNSVKGTGKFDLSLKGKPELSAISGTIATSGSSVAIPSISQILENVNAKIDIANEQAGVSIAGAVGAGGNFKVSGPVSLKPPFDANIRTDLLQIILTDNISFDSSANGTLTYSGPLAGDGRLSGRVEFGETNINLNQAGGSVGAAPIPDIRHVGETGPMRQTRDRAGLIKEASKGAGPNIGLDLQLIAENKIFARGRGLQAELGGNILVGGSLAKVAPSGQIELIRGTLDILGSNLKLTEGRITLQGQFVPYIEFATETTTSEGLATLKIAGPLNAPEITVDSSPERPPEEALAMLLFGNSFAELSPLKVAQIAASLATLSGKGGTEKARKSLGVDSLDLGTDDSGAGQVGAGAYISDKVYTDVTVNTRGESELHLNLDVTDSITLKGSVDNSGETGVGVFFQRDY